MSEVDTDDLEPVTVPLARVEAWAGTDIDQAVPLFAVQEIAEAGSKIVAELAVAAAMSATSLGVVVGDEIVVERHRLDPTRRVPSVVTWVLLAVHPNAQGLEPLNASLLRSVPSSRRHRPVRRQTVRELPGIVAGASPGDRLVGFKLGPTAADVNDEMSAEIDDPFHRVAFDEDFVNAASRRERSADQRVAEAAWRRREEQQVGAQRKQRRRRRLKLVVTMTGVVAVVALVVGFVAFRAPTSGHADIWEQVPTGDRPSLTTTTGERLADPVPLPVGEGSAAFVSTRSDGLPVGFDPCRPISVVVNAAGGPANAVEMVRVVAEQVAAASGLSLVVEGVTDEPASSTRAAYDPDRYGDRWSPILVAWSDPAVIADLEGDVVGIGGAATVALERQEPYAVSGIVYLDAPQLDTLADIEMHTLVTMLHEFGHAVGLDHVEDATQIMNPQAVAMSYGAGDQAGLAQLGSLPCAGRL